MTENHVQPKQNRLLRAAIWVAIGALIAAALICVVWVLIGDSDGMVGRAFLTVALLAGFAGVSILEANLAPRRAPWLSMVSMVSWVCALICGALLIWLPAVPNVYGEGAERFFFFVLIVLILQGFVLHVWLFQKAYARHETMFTTIMTYITIALVAILAVMLIVPLLVGHYVDFRDIYWRAVVAVAILGAVGTALVPLVNVLFAPKTPRPAPIGRPPAGWPTYADGYTPLPVLPDGSPDWNAYYTGYPTYPQGYAPVQAPTVAAPQAAPVAPTPTAAPASTAPAAPPVPPRPDLPPQQAQNGQNWAPPQPPHGA